MKLLGYEDFFMKQQTKLKTPNIIYLLFHIHKPIKLRNEQLIFLFSPY